MEEYFNKVGVEATDDLMEPQSVDEEERIGAEDENDTKDAAQDLVTVGMLRSPELPPPPAYNDDDKNEETFQSCMVRSRSRSRRSRSRSCIGQSGLIMAF